MAVSGDAFIISRETVLVFSWVVYGVLCQIINILGIVTNMINIISFAKQGFQDSVNISLLGLAVSDLGSLITMALTCVYLTPAVIAADLDFDPMDVMYLTSAMLHFYFTRVSGCITAMVTLERCLCITAPLKIKSIITPKRTSVITVSIFIIFFFTGAPVWTVNSLEMKFSPLRNRTIVGLVSTEHRENVEMITFAFNNFFIPFITFVIIVVCTSILSVQLHNKTKWRQATITSSQVDRVSSRNQKAARMVVTISTLFIVCFVPVTIIMLAFAFIQEMSISGIYIGIAMMIGGFGYMLESVNSSMNIFIYYHLSSKYRDSFLKVFCKHNNTKAPLETA